MKVQLKIGRKESKNRKRNNSTEMEQMPLVFHNTIGEKATRQKNTKWLVRSALTKMSGNKDMQPDEIVTKMLSTSGNFRINKISEIINEIYGTVVKYWETSDLSS